MPALTRRISEEAGLSGIEAHILVLFGRKSMMAEGGSSHMVERAVVDSSYRPTGWAKFINDDKMMPKPKTMRRLLEYTKSKATDLDIHEYTFTRVDSDGDFMNVHGCSVSFPANCIKEPQCVTAIVEIDNDKWPSSLGRVISPTFIVDAVDLNVPATVEIPLWCFREFGGEECSMQLLKCSEEGGWMVFQECPLQRFDSIEFQCRVFLPFVVVIPWTFTRYCFNVAFIVYAVSDEFYLVMHLNNEFIIQTCLDRLMQKNKHLDEIILHRVNCRLGEQVTCEIECLPPNDAIEFDPPGPFIATFSEEIARADAYVVPCLLVNENAPDNFIRIRIFFKKGKEGVGGLETDYMWCGREHYGAKLLSSRIRR